MLLKNLICTSRSICHSKLNPSRTKYYLFMQHGHWYSSETPNDFSEPVSSDEDQISQENSPCESEMSYFWGGLSKSEESEQSVYRNKPVPVKQTLAYANKRLFGPLLETSAERKGRLKKKEQGIEEDEHKKKKRQSTKKESNSNMKVQPLIYDMENSHFIGIFPGGKIPNASSGEKSVPKIKIEVCPDDNLDLSQNIDTHIVSQRIKRKTIQFTKQTKYATNNRNTYKSIPYVSSKPQRLIVTSWTNSQEQQNKIAACDNDKSSCHEEQSKGASSPIESRVESTIEETEKNSDTCNIDQASESGDINPINDVLYRSVDNSKFSDVPSSFDLNMIRNFPLFSHTSSTSNPSMSSQSIVKEGITTIGIFDNGYQKLPSVRKILEETMPAANKIALEKWKAKMIKELGEEGFQQYRKSMLDRGLLLHGCIQSQLSGAVPSIEDMPTIGGFWTSIKHVLPDVSNVSALESRLIHPYLYYQGSLDCVGLYRGIPVLIEWKTSSKPKLSLKSMFDDPLQVVAYLGALNFDSNYKIPQQLETALLVVAYETGLPAHTHILKKEHCEYYWNIWCSRLTQFWKQWQL